MKYFVFNKASDYERGYGQHVAVSAQGILVRPDFYGKAAFFSRVLDSFEAGTVWHRMLCRRFEAQHTAVQISYYTAEQLVFENQEERVDLQEIIRSEELSLSEKKERLLPFLRCQFPFVPDILLHGMQGRYLWFLLEIYPQAEEEIRLGDFQVYFPAQSWKDYLPELYQKEMGNNSFLDRYLSVFQSLYDDLGTQIRNLTNCLDQGSAEPEYLEWLADWLNVEEPYMWTEKQLRFLLEHIMEFYGARGTRRGIELFVELYTGEKPFVIEWEEWEGFRENIGQGRLLSALYPNDPGSFTVLVREGCIPGYKEHQALLRMIERLKPVQLELQLIILKPYIFSDRYSYLGVNSVLGQYEEAVLDGSGRIAFATVAEDDERMRR